MDITYREARPEDLPECVHLFAEAMTDLLRRHNVPVPDKPLTTGFRLSMYQHILSTGIFHVAEQAGHVVGFASAIVRDRQWFLAGFWVRPGMQRQHIGMPLLRRVWDAGRASGATTYFVWASSDHPALSAYMKIGMLPGTQLMEFEGQPKPAPASAAYTTRPLNKAVALGLEKIVLGARREQDLDFLVRSGWQGTQVLREGIGVGYFFVHEDHVGPAAWTHPRHADAVLSLACGGLQHVVLAVPGMNHDAIQFAFKSGLRLEDFSHLLMTSPFGHLDRYIPSGPYLF